MPGDVAGPQVAAKTSVVKAKNKAIAHTTTLDFSLKNAAQNFIQPNTLKFTPSDFRLLRLLNG